MTELKYSKYIVKGVRPDLQLAEYRIKTNDFVPGMETRLLHLDEATLRGSFYLSCFWFWKGAETVLVQPHSHEFDEVLALIGTNPEDPQDLCGEVEFWMDNEKHLLRESCLVFVPKRLKHCPFIVRRVDRPIFHFTSGPTGMYT
jgi:hypothetical protein